MPKITILMAVYNAAPYLERSIGSLQRQTLTDFQVICIDDASTDNSLSILEEFAHKDSRIEVIHLKQNIGPAQARQTGLKQANATLISFLDSDDWLSEDALQQAYYTFECHPTTDCVLFNMLMIDAKGNEKPWLSESFDVLSGNEAFERSLDWVGIHGYGVMRSCVYNKVETDTSNASFADENMTRLRLYYSKEVRLCAGTYYYYEAPTSITRRFSLHRFDVLRNNEHMAQLMRRLDLPGEVIGKQENLRYLKLIDVYMLYHFQGHELTADERRKALDEMRRIWQGIDRSLLSPALTRKFGYAPMPSWRLFRLQEWLYFTLRSIFKGK